MRKGWKWIVRDFFVVFTIRSAGFSAWTAIFALLAITAQEFMMMDKGDDDT